MQRTQSKHTRNRGEQNNSNTHDNLLPEEKCKSRVRFLLILGLRCWTILYKCSHLKKTKIVSTSSLREKKGNSGCGLLILESFDHITTNHFAGACISQIKNNATVFETLVVKERANKAVNWHLEDVTRQQQRPELPMVNSTKRSHSIWYYEEEFTRLHTGC